MAPHTGRGDEFGEFSAVFGIEPEEVDRAAHELADHAGHIHRARLSLERSGHPPPPALPGGAAATAVTAATVRISGAATAEGTAAEVSAAQLHSFVAAVGITEAQAAESFAGDRGGVYGDGRSGGRGEGRSKGFSGDLSEDLSEGLTRNPGEESPAGIP